MERHRPVLVDQVTDYVAPQPQDTIVDVTIGTAGHAERILRAMRAGVLIGIDADANALAVAKRRLTSITSNARTRFLEGNFRDIVALLQATGVKKADAILADLGWGSHQISCGRGFSFTVNEPLNMCYGTATGACSCSALDIVNSWREREIADVIAVYGEERWAKRIARRIVQTRENRPIVMTHDLASIVADAVPARYHAKGRHPATRTFQALRIAVNDEIQALEQFLGSVPGIVAPGARIVIISFHSLEDRTVKQTFARWEEQGLGVRAKRALTPSDQECLDNRRARSAKLRTFTFSHHL